MQMADSCHSLRRVQEFAGISGRDIQCQSCIKDRQGLGEEKTKDQIECLKDTKSECSDGITIRKERKVKRWGKKVYMYRRERKRGDQWRDGRVCVGK